MSADVVEPELSHVELSDEARVFSISASTQESIVKWRIALNLVHRGKGADFDRGPGQGSLMLLSRTRRPAGIHLGMVQEVPSSRQRVGPPPTLRLVGTTVVTF